MSKQLVIAIDCDDVLINATDYIVAKYNKLYNTDVRVEDAHSSGNVQWQAEREEVFVRLNSIQKSDEYATIKPEAATVDAIKSLARDYELHLVTARPEEVMLVTRRMIDAYFPGCFTSLEHVGPDRSKGEVCKRLGAILLVDDNIRHLQDALDNGIQYGLWFGNYPWQSESSPADGRIFRCESWSDVISGVSNIAS